MGKNNFGGSNPNANANANVNPIICDPRYVVHDSYVPRYIPVIHPVVHVNRQNIVNVPQHSVQQSQQNQVVDPGLPDHNQACQWCNCPPRPNCWW
ncbi:MAG: spore coat protein D [Sporolactobacillus sp.]